MKITKDKVIRVVLFFIILCVIALVAMKGKYQITESQQQIIDGGWEITINGEVTEDASISEIRMPHLEQNDQVILTRVLDKTPYLQTVLRVYTRYSAIKVYLDDELIYKSQQENFENGELIGNGYHWISLPAGFGGKELTIVYDIGEVNAFTSIDPIVTMNSVYVSYDLVYNHIITIIIVGCLLTIGLIGILFCVFFGFTDNRFQMLLWSSLFAIFVGTWMICSTRLIEIFYRNFQGVCYMEYLSMYSACICLLLYITVFFQKKEEKRFFRIITWGFVALSTVLIILNQTGIRHFPKTVLIFHGYALISAILVIIVLFNEVKNHKRAEQSFWTGILIMVGTLILELIRYRYNKLCIPANKLDQSFIPVGVMAFILCLFVSFFFRMIERVAEEMERKTLYDMAYMDSLTGIRNRAWCEKVMQEFEQKKLPITIINMDLNYFKQVNDSFGHAAGDELLIQFTSILSGIFREDDCVGRMGGDEFVVILHYIPDRIVEEHMARLKKKIELENEKNEKTFQISFSYGYASDATGAENTPWRVYEMADQAMYQYKKKARKE